jgi:hypothetical protein
VGDRPPTTGGNDPRDATGAKHGRWSYGLAQTIKHVSRERRGPAERARSPEGLLGRTSDGLEENEFFVCVHIHYNITCWIPLDLPEQTSADGNIFGAKTLLRAGHPPRKIFRHHDWASFQPQHSMFVQTRKIPVFWAFWVPKLPKT